MDNDDEPYECEGGYCQAKAGETGVTSCIHCGGELHEINGLWYHWTSFDNQWNLIEGAQVQDYVKPIKQNDNE
jgi:hypothetical protein